MTLRNATSCFLVGLFWVTVWNAGKKIKKKPTVFITELSKSKLIFSIKFVNLKKTDSPLIVSAISVQHPAKKDNPNLINY